MRSTAENLPTMMTATAAAASRQAEPSLAWALLRYAAETVLALTAAAGICVSPAEEEEAL